MPEYYWSSQWPNLNSISLAIDNPPLLLSPMELGALYRIVWHIASKAVHSAYSEPSNDIGIPYDIDVLCRVVGCTKAEWETISHRVLDHLVIDGGTIRLKDESSVRISRSTREAIPSEIHRTVRARDGAKCIYCGDTEGPFHLDHLWPVSKGGRNEATNIVTACATCNLSKGSKSLREWMEASR